jgi:hypothetical protein
MFWHSVFAMMCRASCRHGTVWTLDLTSPRRRRVKMEEKTSITFLEMYNATYIKAEHRLQNDDAELFLSFSTGRQHRLQ